MSQSAEDTYPIECLDANYSTTRLVTRQQSVLDNYTDAECTSMWFLPDGEGRKDEGGLRTKGYFKQSLPDKPLITVITVVFNGDKYLEEAILSVINQAYDNIEYLIIDGGSIDGTLELIKRYNKQIDYWISEPDKGIYDAMNKAVRLARGGWCYFIGYDDVLLPGFIQLIDKATEEKHAYYGNVEIRNTGKVSGGKFTKYKLMQQNICHQAILYPTKFLVEFQYNLKYSLLADYDLNLKLFSKYEFIYLNVNIAIFNDKGASSNRDEIFYKDFPAIILANLGLGYYIIKSLRTFFARIKNKVCFYYGVYRCHHIFFG